MMFSWRKTGELLLNSAKFAARKLGSTREETQEGIPQKL